LWYGRGGLNVKVRMHICTWKILKPRERYIWCWKRIITLPFFFFFFFWVEKKFVTDTGKRAQLLTSHLPALLHLESFSGSCPKRVMDWSPGLLLSQHNHRPTLRAR
jgi:hypothetical protein